MVAPLPSFKKQLTKRFRLRSSRLLGTPIVEVEEVLMSNPLRVFLDKAEFDKGWSFAGKPWWRKATMDELAVIIAKGGYTLAP